MSSEGTTMFAVFAIPKNKNRSVDPPCLDPLDYGIGNEPYHHLLLRRGRVGLFHSRTDANAALKRTGLACKGQPWTKDFAFVVLECRDAWGRKEVEDND